MVYGLSLIQGFHFKFEYRRLCRMAFHHEKAFQDFRKDVAKTVAVLTIAPLVINHEKYKDSPSQYHAKAMQFAATLAISRNDLPPVLHQKLDNWLATGNPDTPTKDEEKKKSSKRKGEGEDQERGKKPRASTTEKKRKK